jgi:hypothetical protein
MYDIGSSNYSSYDMNHMYEITLIVICEMYNLVICEIYDLTFIYENSHMKLPNFISLI